MAVIRAMLTITVFESDPATGEQRTMTIGEADAATLARSAGEWAHDVVARMAGADALPIDDVPIALWDSLECVAS